jgi:aspartate aminotransferase
VEPSARAVELMTFSRRAAPPAAPGAVRLDSGDPDLVTPREIREAMSAALEDGWVRYADPSGDPELRSALAARVSSLAGTEYAAAQVLVTHGATGALTAAVLGCVDPGDAVVLPEPTYSLYGDLVLLAGGQVRLAPTVPPEFRLDLEALEEAARGARLIVLCSPCNPTGAVYSREELEAVAEIARRQGALLLADEAYESIVYGPGRFTSVLELGLSEQVIYVQSFSKTYCMTGWRLGYLAASEDLVPAFARIHRTVNGPVNTAVQRAALAALGLGDGWLETMLGTYERRRELVWEALAGTSAEGVRPEGTFYAFVPHPPSLSSTRMAELALRHGVAVRPGSEYGPSGEGYLRLAFSSSDEDLAVGMERLRRALAEAESGADG